MREERKLFWMDFFKPETRKRAVKVAAIVAPIVILINHCDELAALKITSALCIKSLLTFFVPYSVSSYSSAKALSDKRAEDR
ncbi:MAG: nitrate/nitrite transporter NrtS [Deltaproteobacteria bacterium]